MADKSIGGSRKGGAREGAGRPRLNVVRVDITLTMEQIEWLKARGNVSEQIRKLIDAEMEKDNSQHIA